MLVCVCIVQRKCNIWTKYKLQSTKDAWILKRNYSSVVVVNTNLSNLELIFLKSWLYFKKTALELWRVSSNTTSWVRSDSRGERPPWHTGYLFAACLNQRYAETGCMVGFSARLQWLTNTLVLTELIKNKVFFFLN